MKYGWRGILSMMFLIAGLGLFTAMHFLPLLIPFPDILGWTMWINIQRTIRDSMAHDVSPFAIAYSSFLAISLLIVASPFLGNVWRRSLLAWSIVGIFSGVATAGLWFATCKDIPLGGLSAGGWCLLLAPVSNFIGLLLARPLWLERKQLVAGVPL